MILRLAFLGALRHYKRSLVVIAAAGAACAVMVAVGSTLNGVTESFFESVIPLTGHIRISDDAAEKALNPLALTGLVGGAREKIEAIRALGDPRIAAVEPLLPFGALLVEEEPSGESEPRNLAMRGIGVEADTRFADGARGSVTAGSFLPDGRGILLSERAARLLGTGLGEGILVLVQDRSGQPWYEEFPITGLFATESADFDETTFYLSHAKAEEMLDVEGSTREIRILLEDRGAAEALLPAVAGAVGAASGGAAPRAGSGLRARAWRDMNSTVLSIVVFIQVVLGFVTFLFAVVAATIIANTILMSVLERIREFGTMRAIGLKARSLSLMVLAEGAMLGLAGSVVGLALGAGVAAFLADRGLDLGGIMESLGMSRYNRPRLDPLYFGFCALASVVVSLAATAGAARSVSRRSVAESLTST